MPNLSQPPGFYFSGQFEQGLLDMSDRPIACVTWLVMAIVLLLVMKKSMRIYDSGDPSVEYHIGELMVLPYTLTLKRRPQRSSDRPAHSGYEEEVRSATKSITIPTQSEDSSPNLINRQNNTHEPKPTVRHSQTSTRKDSNLITIRIEMPSNYGFRSWPYYEVILESVAVGIYLYATFVLTSTLFLNADKAMWFAVVMALCLSGVRVLCMCQGPVLTEVKKSSREITA